MDTRRHKRFDLSVVSQNFDTKMRRLIKKIAALTIDEERGVAIDQEIRLYDPMSKNDVQYVKGRMETIDITGENMKEGPQKTVSD